MLDWCENYLAQKGDEHPRLSAEWLLSEVVHKPRIDLYVNFDEPLSQAELDTMHSYVVRRAKGEPLQYIVGHAPFRHIELTCAPGVLIPRPETEVLVDCVLAYSDELQQDTQQDVKLLEVGCGSGCISLSCAYERLYMHCVATDISSDATELATKNAVALDLQEKTEIICCDMCEGVSSDYEGCFDVMVSNPPYIPTNVMEELPCEVSQWEPHLALHGGADGLDIFRRLIGEAQRFLKPSGAFFCELHEESLQDAKALLEAQDAWHDIVITKDLAGRDRIISAKKNEVA